MPTGATGPTLFVDPLPITLDAPSGEGILFVDPLPVSGISGGGATGATGASGGPVGATGSKGSTGAGVSGATGATGAGGGGGGGLLASVQYAPATVATVTGAAALTAFNTTNLTVSFVAPASGDVLVRLTGAVQNLGSEALFGLLDHTTGDQVGVTAFLSDDASGTGILNQSVVIKVTGLVSGDTYQYDWAGVSAGLSMFCIGVQGIPSPIYAGPACMEVWSA